MTEDNIGSFQTLMNLYDPLHLFEKSTETNLLRLKEPQADIPEQSRLKFLAKFLTMFPFFCRIRYEKLCALVDQI